MRRMLVCVISALVLSGCVRGSSMQAISRMPAITVTGDASAVPAQALVALVNAVKRGGSGVTAIVMRNGKQLFRLDIGAIDANAQYPVASSSKWMTAALVMTVVDEGKLSLDEPVSKYFPEFHGEAAKITLRDLLAQTAGQGSLRGLVDIRQDPRITLAESAREIARRPLEDPPGSVFKYGGPGFQIAGALVELVTGKRWADLFDERISKPLGMHRTYWVHLPDSGVPPKETRNPLLQGGVVTTAQDYMCFLTMLAQRGEYGGSRILSVQAVETMETVQTLGKSMGYKPPGARAGKNLQYALGNWCETWSAEGRCRLVSSSGAFGTYPWIDWESGLYGIFFTRTRLPLVVKYFLRARTAILASASKTGNSGTH